MRDEGSIAHTDMQERRWGIFFEQTNPISSVDIQKDTLLATNE